MTLAHDVIGTGPAVLLLHSTVCDRRMWDPQVGALTGAGFRVVRCDLRGYGETPLPEEPYDEAQDIVDLLDWLGLDRVAMVGSSGGGQAAQEAAARWPQRVTALALLCTALVGHTPGPQLRAFGEREDALLEAGDIDGATELNVDTWLGRGADAATRDKVRAMQRHAFAVQLAVPAASGPARQPYQHNAITAPTLLVCGARDLPDFRSIARTLADRLSDARLVELDWAGHLPNLERPDELNRILVDFLTSRESRRES